MVRGLRASYSFPRTPFAKRLRRNGTMDRGLWTTALVGFLAPIVLFAPFTQANAGLLDWLFGRREPAAVAAPAHPDVTLTPDRQEIAKRRQGKAQPKLVVIDPRDTLARTIDPVKNPDWWLADPTLRKGDILFLDDRVVVFVGKKPGERAAYVPVGQTRLVSKSERKQILAMARGRTPLVLKTRLAGDVRTTGRFAANP